MYVQYSRPAIASLILALRYQDQLFPNIFLLAGVQFFLYHLILIPKEKKNIRKVLGSNPGPPLHSRLLQPVVRAVAFGRKSSHHSITETYSSYSPPPRFFSQVFGSVSQWSHLLIFLENALEWKWTRTKETNLPPSSFFISFTTKLCLPMWLHLDLPTKMISATFIKIIFQEKLFVKSQIPDSSQAQVSAKPTSFLAGLTGLEIM